MKLVLALWEADPGALLHENLRNALRDAGATRLQVNLDDDHIPETVLPLAHKVAGWQVDDAHQLRRN